MTRQSNYRFAWRAGNSFELLIDGPVFFPSMLNAIEAAQRSVLMESYLFESGRVSDRFITALQLAAQRGVAVCLLLDAFGALHLKGADRNRLTSAGVRLAFYNALHHAKWLRNLLRNHRKLLLVDGAVAFAGGAGITDAFEPASAPPWRETMLRITGPVVDDWLELFATTWAEATGKALHVTPLRAVERAQGVWGRVVASSGLRARNDITRSVVRHIARAERRVWLATAYFVPSRRLRRELRHAAQRGADVRLLLPGANTDHPSARWAGRRFYARLLANGVRVYEFQPRFMHAKVLLCDDWVSIGSSNLDHWNLRWNLEANQELDDVQMARQVADMFVADFGESLELDSAAWQRRRWHARLMERIWGMVDAWLKRLRGVERR
jgi:phosphatidylserine/phosphatidylglycerophosphate/cardiolipin synthase-like enzyme